jgi:hypothetical protein
LRGWAGEEMTVPSGYDFSKKAVVIVVLAMTALAALTVGGTYLVLKAFVLHNPNDPLSKAGGLSRKRDIPDVK